MLENFLTITFFSAILFSIVTSLGLIFHILRGNGNEPSNPTQQPLIEQSPELEEEPQWVRQHTESLGLTAKKNPEQTEQEEEIESPILERKVVPHQYIPPEPNTTKKTKKKSNAGRPQRLEVDASNAGVHIISEEVSAEIDKDTIVMKKGIPVLVKKGTKVKLRFSKEEQEEEPEEELIIEKEDKKKKHPLRPTD